MSKEIRIKHECGACNGTGLYVGMAERSGAAVVCHSCKGQGWKESVFVEFTERKEKPGVRRVFQTNPGVVIGEREGLALSDFGGMPLEDWKAGKPFPAGSENRAYSCPRWWTQSAGGSMPEWDECYSNIGRSFSQCAHFCNKAECWKRWDSETANVELTGRRSAEGTEGTNGAAVGGPR